LSKYLTTQFVGLGVGRGGIRLLVGKNVEEKICGKKGQKYRADVKGRTIAVV
jgi:hypothetical protein